SNPDVCAEVEAKVRAHYGLSADKVPAEKPEELKGNDTKAAKEQKASETKASKEQKTSKE
ncbi:MAG: DNA recombination/repair protein RecA, partial [Lachnospiraceae bacterium]|nr:DNA recombination/repair protein RecA [Lachnospiraceae bacterium]